MKLIAPALLFALILFSCKPYKKLTGSKHQYMEASYSEIQKNVQGADVSLLNDSIKILFPEHLLFAIGKAELREDTYPQLQRLASVLNKFENTSILITGFTDTSGTEKINDPLSAKRAENTKEALLKNNVKPARVFTWGRGSRDPIATNDTEAGRIKNRRVEFIILYNYNTRP